MDEEAFVQVGEPIQRLRSVSVVDGRRVLVTWSRGASHLIDLSPALHSHRSFVALRSDDALFRTVRVNEFGDALVWNDGSELSSVWVEELIPLNLNNSAFRSAMEELGLSLDGMASRLGIARRLVADYRKDKPIPTVVALATRYLVEHHKRPE